MSGGLFSAISNSGYRENKQKLEETQLQRGFDNGFSAGNSIGFHLGEIYAECRINFQKNSDQLAREVLEPKLQHLESILFNDISNEKIHELIGEVVELASSFGVVNAGSLLEPFIVH